MLQKADAQTLPGVLDTTDAIRYPALLVIEKGSVALELWELANTLLLLFIR